MKKIILRTVIILSSVLIISLLGLWYVYDNIKTYSVYYAQHMPRGEGEEPELFMLIDNLWWLHKPDISGIEYDTVSSTIVKKEENYRRFGSSGYKSGRYHYSDIKSNSYILDKNMKLLYALDSEYSEVDIDTVDKVKLIEEIEEFVNPIIKAQSKPDINLQFIFNWLYEDEFK